MKFVSIKRSRLQEVGIEGTMAILSIVPLVFSKISLVSLTSGWTTVLAILASLMFLASAFYILRKPYLGKILAEAAATSSLISIFPVLTTDPNLALSCGVTYIFALFVLFEFKVKRSVGQPAEKPERYLQRARWAGFTLASVSFLAFLIFGNLNSTTSALFMLASIFVQFLTLAWGIKQPLRVRNGCIFANVSALFLLIFSLHARLLWFAAFITGLSAWLLLPDSSSEKLEADKWWSPLLDHPGRSVIVTFFLLCSIGTFLLVLPIASSGKAISLIDAAFTSVSAVCITGLIVLDTPNDFSHIGQFFILLLIQLGGLGIMSVATVAMHSLGHRISLQQERVLSSSVDSTSGGLFDALYQIVKFSFFIELAGALVLTALFYRSGLLFFEALWKGIFTAVSAFCNAGFALQSDSLVSFQSDPLILNAVAFLIICGGIAPAVCLLVPRWLQGQKIPIAARIALVTTAALLLSGTLFFLVFEWNGILANLSSSEKILNAWFQSVTLRTAGFNSVELESILGPTFLIILAMMFIGGSPGGTAGGVKTTTIGLLALTFWSSACGQNEIILQNRRILPATIFKAVSVVASGLLILFFVVLMLLITQDIPTQKLLFEATSALGTVGLSTGATSQLDSIGKVIIIFAMFMGRIGPVTLFTILSRKHFKRSSEKIDARINLT
jgi:trk system potassium uptake protein TrkH